jgi:hypothetical protein
VLITASWEEVSRIMLFGVGIDASTNAGSVPSVRPLI